MKNETQVQWIEDCCRKGFPRRKIDVQLSVANFVKKTSRKNPFKDGVPCNKWYHHPKVSIRTSEAVTAASAAVSDQDIRHWFQNIEIYLKDNGYFQILSDPSRVFNGDETNFQLCPKSGKVIAIKGETDVYEMDHAQETWKVPHSQCYSHSAANGPGNDCINEKILQEAATSLCFIVRTKTNLQRAWNKSWSEEQSAGEEDVNDNEDGDGVNEATGICSKIPGFEQCDENDDIGLSSSSLPSEIIQEITSDEELETVINTQNNVSQQMKKEQRPISNIIINYQ
ncbi:hypothetical protein MML48_3g00005845 [Holotrichia oblita]|uniref:Uncharacterized protein n=1 Tax=Holotrichia oblita TaxID=644536 RepID=A0ACB9TI04_HOLOL|nr:hypothetical protein MML48_3g00005845 [Holotrichia oblita]